MITPKDSFQKSDHGKRWQDTVDSAGFHAAATAAMLQMQMSLNAPDMGTAAANHWRMEGARQFLMTLMGLTAPIPRPKPPTDLNLNHRV